jgi:DNA modification methylase
VTIYEGHGVTLHHGDCLDVLRSLPDCSVDSVVTDPPYNLTAGKKGGTGEASVNLESPYGRARIGTGNGSGGFMGKAWDDYDHFPGGFYGWCEAWATECLRVLKPGGHLLAFGGTRTWHRLACAVEDAGLRGPRLASRGCTAA